MIAVLDGNAFAISTAMSILSGSMPVIMPTEIEEIKRRLAMRLFTLSKMHPWDRMYIAMDKRPYWRTAYMEANCKDDEGQPVVYKGNREGKEDSWPLVTPKGEIVGLALQFYHDIASLVNGKIVMEQGLEADDIASFVATSADDDVMLITSDSDWKQLIGGKVVMYDLYHQEITKDKADIRVKHIAGDRGDGIPGMRKTAKTRWGKDGAIKLLEEFDSTCLPEFAGNYHMHPKLTDKETLKHNTVLTTLPAPHFSVEEAVEYLLENSLLPLNPNGKWEDYFLTPVLQERLSDTAERESFILSLRAKLQDNMAEKWGI